MSTHCKFTAFLLTRYLGRLGVSLLLVSRMSASRSLEPFAERRKCAKRGRSRFDISASLRPHRLQTRIYARSRVIAVIQQKGKFKIWKALYVVITYVLCI
jgi:hypothetical protein